MGGVIKKAGWFAVAVVGAFAFAVIALKRGEPVSAIWIVIAAPLRLHNHLPFLQPIHRSASAETRPEAHDPVTCSR